MPWTEAREVYGFTSRRFGVWAKAAVAMRRDMNWNTFERPNRIPPEANCIWCMCDWEAVRDLQACKESIRANKAKPLEYPTLRNKRAKDVAVG